MLSLWGMLTRIIQFRFFLTEFLNVFVFLLPSLWHLFFLFFIFIPPTDGLQGRMQTRFEALLESFTADRRHCNIPPFKIQFSIWTCGYIIMRRALQFNFNEKIIDCMHTSCTWSFSDLCFCPLPHAGCASPCVSWIQRGTFKSTGTWTVVLPGCTPCPLPQL